MIRWAAHRPAVVWASAAALLLAGRVAFTRLPLATRPVVELPRLEITIEWPGAAPELVETYLTAPIEAAVQGVRGVWKVSSESEEGRARLRVDLEPRADIQLAPLGILERLEVLRPDFPPGSTPPRLSNYVPEELAEQPLLRYTLAGPYTPGTLARIARERVVPRLAVEPYVRGERLYFVMTDSLGVISGLALRRRTASTSRPSAATRSGSSSARTRPLPWPEPKKTARSPARSGSPTRAARWTAPASPTSCRHFGPSRSTTKATSGSSRTWREGIRPGGTTSSTPPAATSARHAPTSGSRGPRGRCSAAARCTPSSQTRSGSPTSSARGSSVLEMKVVRSLSWPLSVYAPRAAGNGQRR